MEEDKLHRCLELLGWGMLIIVLSFILNSCGVCKNCQYLTNAKDSVYIERVDSIYFRDTIIKVQMKDSMVYMVADSSSHLETDIASSDAWIENNKLHHRLSNKRELIPINIQMPGAITQEKHYIRQIVQQKVNQLTPMQSFWMILGKFFAIALGVILLIWLIKRKV